ncbi:MAG: IS66 family transposase [Pseudobdellovibrionaceae bacterium]
MRALENENDPRILRELAILMNAEILRLQSRIKTIEEQKNKAEQKSFPLEESLSILRKKFFGKSSEKFTDRARSKKDEEEILLHSQNFIPLVKNKSTKKLLEEIYIHEASKQDLIDASMDFGLENPSVDQWEKVENLFDESTEIEIVERSYKKIIHKKQKYKLKAEFNQTEKENVFISANGTTKLLPGASYSVDFAVSTVVDKYLNHLPLERQVRMMDSLGLMNIKPQVLYNLAKITSIYLEPVVDQIREEILSSKVVHSDETPWPINNKKDSDGYMWIVTNNRGSFYRFEPTRSGKVIRETLKDFKGIVVTDGYAGYAQFKDDHAKNINQNKLAMCHAHARRYFFEIKDDYPIIEEYLILYQKLFAIEKQARDFEELKILRTDKSKLIIDDMKKWLMEKYPEARLESKFKLAIEYTMKNWSELTLFLQIPEVPLTNNEAERIIRQAVMGRKNFYGSRSIDGADVAAIIYSVIESCKKVELDPRNYLRETIRLCAEGKTPQTPFEFAKSLRQ